jgi:hypothetical protein
VESKSEQAKQAFVAFEAEVNEAKEAERPFDAEHISARLGFPGCGEVWMDAVIVRERTLLDATDLGEVIQDTEEKIAPKPKAKKKGK